jgi:penicillin-binding protein 2
VGVHDAIVHSCDIFFYNVGKQLGIDTISYYAMKLGLGRKTGVDLPGEESGLIPSEDWKQRVYHQKWYPGETISVSIGQGAVVTTPMQLAYTIGGIALGGVFRQPHLLMSNQPAPEVDFPLAESTVETVSQGMYGVVNEPGGTAYGTLHVGSAGADLATIELSGKTGSAQVISNDLLKKQGRGADQKDNAWFVGFAPRRNPDIVVAVLVQGGEHGATAAAPIARDVVKAFYDKKHGKFPPQLITQNVPAGTALGGQQVVIAEPQPVNKPEQPIEESVPSQPGR